MWLRHPKEESHMAQLLNAMQVKYSNYSNYSKLVAGKFRHLGGQFFFDIENPVGHRSEEKCSYAHPTSEWGSVGLCAPPEVSRGSRRLDTH